MANNSIFTSVRGWIKRVGIVTGVGIGALVIYLLSGLIREKNPPPVVVVAGMRTVEARGALLGSYGRRSDIKPGQRFVGAQPWDKHVYRRYSGAWPWKSVLRLKVQEYTVTLADTAYLERLGITFDSAASVGGGGYNTSTAHYRIVLEEIDNLRRLVEELNDSIRSGTGLADLLGDREYRIVTAVAVLFDHHKTRYWDRGMDVGLQELGTQGKVSHSDSVSINDGAIVGYRYARICWSPNGLVRELVTDEQGDDGVPCPPGSSQQGTPPVE